MENDSTPEQEELLSMKDDLEPSQQTINKLKQFARMYYSDKVIPDNYSGSNTN